ncbi:MAG: class I SAM-dependent methyltransferase [Alkalibacterium gilvum]|uniref:16S rRNA m(2)G 1207 methyltransferase n=1 Tax=Alkalibacterium gilvum TaxID=1130080 RepID=A0A1H6SVR6_9LACT|nr:MULTISPECIES: class I SAM-dependent methyltransferase [Alkalibacterium]MDN6294652.1 class I SAM-dependent methyltransferase [Alkalibacterium sp.]MDN6295900.1 class I SAM-dependent methyltransferase [Alkalibacterium sp.]MDN6385299.1 class I SAM-dependent methyltransferase [Alkalibacterium sp.]MDN6398293.1 class I SAM-dependent methyltransferase [Alkalibacterium sp.]MDN6730179.1 class I SAM-dependent methyltransferase [Alkalibacterium sp.]
MTDHYFTSNPNAKKNEKEFEITLKNNKLKLTTDSGVFSKERVDYGSKVMIESIDPSIFPNEKLLDMGCGYGPVGLSLAKAYPNLTVHMVDVNERALDLARKNALENGINNVNIYMSSIYEEIKEKDFGAIISNPPIRAGKKVVHEIISESYRYLAEDGVLIIVIQKKQGAPSAKQKMIDTFGNVERIALDKGYWVLQSKK